MSTFQPELGDEQAYQRRYEYKRARIEILESLREVRRSFGSNPTAKSRSVRLWSGERPRFDPVPSQEF
jgi:hypothetical protein